MSQPRITVLFYSTYGTNHRMASLAAEAAAAAGADVRLRRIPETAPADVIAGQDAWKAAAEAQSEIPEATLDDMEWADGYFFAAPTRFGGLASQARAFIDRLGPLWQQGKLNNKTITAVTSAQNLNGGQETTLQGLYITAMHWGAILVPPGYGDAIKFQDGGNPYGYSTTPDSFDETGEASIAYQAKRLVAVTRQVLPLNAEMRDAA